VAWPARSPSTEPDWCVAFAVRAISALKLTSEPHRRQDQGLQAAPLQVVSALGLVPRMIARALDNHGESVGDELTDE